MIIGWIGSLCLAFSGVPQAYKCYCQGHSRGLSLPTLSLWFAGEICYIVATIGEFGLVAWLLFNYFMNLFCVSVMLWYWFRPRENYETRKAEKDYGPSIWGTISAKGDGLNKMGGLG